MDEYKIEIIDGTGKEININDLDEQTKNKIFYDSEREILRYKLRECMQILKQRRRRKVNVKP